MSKTTHTSDVLNVYFKWILELEKLSIVELLRNFPAFYGP
jgi:hypothetical protein